VNDKKKGGKLSTIKGEERMWGEREKERKMHRSNTKRRTQLERKNIKRQNQIDKREYSPGETRERYR
jgi:hypothetical protein